MNAKSKIQSLVSKVLSPKSRRGRSTSKVQASRSKVHHSAAHRPAVVEYLSLFLCAGFALLLLATGRTAPRPLNGGR
jgi:hypothetical protein